ncbi:MAG: cell division protein CrgA [Actinobacteria bacterium]|nr:cell division protein CrgA [Actinomycetota bacterium]
MADEKPKKLPPKSKVVAPTSKVAPAPDKSSRAEAEGDDKPKKLPPKSKVDKGGAGPKGRRPATTKISRADSAPDASSRYTPPTPHFDEMPSPMWVPILMFTMFGLGMLVIFLNYVSLLPGATSNWYLLVGLALILGGIITATQFR